MSGPPTDIPASALWAKLQTKRPSVTVDFPRKDTEGNAIGQLKMRVLTEEERTICSAAAEQVVKRSLKETKSDSLAYQDMYAEALCVEILARACRDESDEERPAFPNSNAMRRILTTEECAALFEEYLVVKTELGPTCSSMTEEEFEAWVERLALGGAHFPFASLSLDLQRILLVTMARLLQKSRTENSSAGSPLDEPLNDDMPTSNEPSPSESSASETE